MATEFKTLKFNDGYFGQREKVDALKKAAKEGWEIVSETLTPGHIKGCDACCLATICLPMGFCAGRTDNVITVTLKREPTPKTEETMSQPQENINALPDGSENKELQIKKKVYEPILGVETEALIKRANLFLEDGDFDEADRYFEQALNQDPENSDAYLGKLMALRRVCNVDKLFESPAPVANIPLFQKVLRFVDGETRAHLENQAQTQLEAFSKVEKLIEERNSVYSGNCLGNTFTEEHSRAIRAGTFEGMSLGDYWTINEMNWRIADFDYLAYSDKAEVDPSKHHLIIVPDKILYKGNMSGVSWRDTFNDQEPDTSGGYASSEMRSSGLAPAEETIKAAFGEEHILTYRGCIEDDKANGGIWTDCGIELMTKEMVRGSKAFSLFRLHKDSIKTGAFLAGYWLQDVASKTEFHTVDNVGTIDKQVIDNPFIKEGVRPFFALY